VIQIQTAAWYVRLVDRLFGAPAPVAGVVEGPRPVAAPVPAAGPSMPHIGRILYATDLSETARHAVRYACTFADRFGAEVTLLHVVPDVLEEISAGVGINLLDHMDRKHWETFNRDGIGRAKEAIRQRIAETAAAVKDRMPACPLSTQKVCIEVGNPVEAIVRNAAEGGFDLVIMGTHGHGRVEGAVMGSVAAGVIRRCPVPVLVVRLPDPAPASEALAA
jgi:nucleotide-binding universal stress UspA family protein